MASQKLAIHLQLVAYHLVVTNAIICSGLLELRINIRTVGLARVPAMRMSGGRIRKKQLASELGELQ